MVNIGDVARHLGVSRSTVSYALTGNRPVSTETKRRVEAAIKELNFVPSARARALADSRSFVLAALAPLGQDATPAVALQFVNGTAQASRRHEYDLLLVVGEEAVHGIDRLLVSDRADGLVLLDVTEADPRLAAARGTAKPLVIIGHPREDLQHDCVDLDWHATGALLTRHVTDLGHRTIGLLGAQPEAYERHLAYADRFRAGALDAANAAQARLHACGARQSLAETAASLDELFRVHPDTTALVIQQEAIVPHVHGLLGSLGRRVPEDVSVVGVTLDTFAHDAVRPVSGVDNPSVELTGRAVELLVARIDAPDRPTQRTLLTPHFHDRGSTRCPH